MNAPANVLVAYATKHGSTREVAEAIAATLCEQGVAVDVAAAGETCDVTAYSGVVLGGALYMGRLHPDACRFAERHSTALGLMPLAVFAMGPKRLEDDDVAGARKQLDVALDKLPISPQLVAIFGGVLDPTKLRFPWKRLPASDARDWDAIRSWAEDAGALFATTAVEAVAALA